jgi:hypothetical protein
VAGGAVAIASFVFVLLMRAEPAPVSGKPTADKVSVAPVPGDPIAPGHSADHPTTTDKPTPPVADAGAGTPTPTPTPPPPPTPVENTNVHVVLSAPYAFSVSDESGRPLSAAAQSHDLHLAPKQVLRLRSQANHFSQRLTVEGRPGETMRWKAPALGRLTVWAVRETCQLSLDGDSIGSPPISELPVPSGKHTLKLTCPDGDQTVDYVDVTAGTTTLAKLK